MMQWPTITPPTMVAMTAFPASFDLTAGTVMLCSNVTLQVRLFFFSVQSAAM